VKTEEARRKVPVLKPRVYSIPGVTVSLVREPGVTLATRPQMKAPAETARILAEYIGDRDRETFVVALLSVRHRVLALNNIVSVGCATQALVHPREVFKPAILAGASAVVVAHNHPSGDPEPSAEDLALTRRLTAAGTLLGIEVLDHVILGELGRFVSLKERRDVRLCCSRYTASGRDGAL
jgi:DNA repair protein RadC